MRQLNISICFLFMLVSIPMPVYPFDVAQRELNFQESPQISIQWPLPGQALLGNVAISGNMAVEGFRSAELLFGYANDPTDTWFLIAQYDTPIENSVLADWDTTLITDGNYDIKLSITLESGNQVTALIQGVRVRNYSPIETDTPTPVTPTSTQVPGDTPIPEATSTPSLTPIPPTQTPLPTNPVMLTSSDIVSGLGRGVLAALALFLLLGAYVGIRSALRNRA